MCNHEIDIKCENGFIISYCKLCGKILDKKPTGKRSVERKEVFNDGSMLRDNGGQILHD